MTLMDTSFTPGEAVAGGSILAMGVCLLYTMTGHLAGLSSIYDGAAFLGGFKSIEDDYHWKGPFTGGFMLGAVMIFSLLPDSIGMGGVATPPLLLAVAGGLVGLGARVGSGCTSGHGICGMARLSKRSIVAVAIFMMTGTFVSTLCAGLDILGRGSSAADAQAVTSSLPVSVYEPWLPFRAVSIMIAILQLLGGLTLGVMKSAWRTTITSAASGFLFSVGLGISGMGNRAKVWHFLTLNSQWDPTLIFFMASAIPIVYTGFKFMKRWWTQPLLACSNLPDAPLFRVPAKTEVDRQLMIGAMIFGAGWGLGGICPGPAVILASSGVPSIWMYWMPAMIGGMWLSKRVVNMSFWNSRCCSKAVYADAPILKGDTTSPKKGPISPC